MNPNTVSYLYTLVLHDPSLYVHMARIVTFGSPARILQVLSAQVAPGPFEETSCIHERSQCPRYNRL